MLQYSLGLPGSWHWRCFFSFTSSMDLWPQTSHSNGWAPGWHCLKCSSIWESEDTCSLHSLHTWYNKDITVVLRPWSKDHPVININNYYIPGALPPSLLVCHVFSGYSSDSSLRAWCWGGWAEVEMTQTSHSCNTHNSGNIGDWINVNTYIVDLQASAFKEVKNI